MIIGNVGKDPEIRNAGSSKVANFSVATTERYNDKQGQRQEKTDWHNIVIWGRLAEIVEQYVRKGTKLYLEGKITTRSWDNAEGQKQYRTELVCSQMTMLGGKQDSGFNQDAGGSGFQAQASNAHDTAAPKYDDVPMDDDLPF